MRWKSNRAAACLAAALLALPLSPPAAAEGRGSAFWRAVRPRGIVAQYAGGIGFVSAGAEWAYGRREMFETGLLAGWLPPFSTGHGKLTLTLRQSFAPFELPLRGSVSCQPLALSLYANAISGHEFWMAKPKRYPRKYYGFSSGLRLGLSAGQRMKLRLPRRQRWKALDCVMLYYDFNACDLDIVSCLCDSRVSLWDIVNVSLGVKVRFW